MHQPPAQIDGAQVALWAVSAQDSFEVLLHEGQEIPIPGLAICCYPDDDHYWLYKCDRHWEVVLAWHADSLESAKRVAQTHAAQETVAWHAWRE